MGIRELTPTIVNKFVKKIIVQVPDKSSGHHRQKIELVWNFIEHVNLLGDDQTVERQKKGRTHVLRSTYFSAYFFRKYSSVNEILIKIPDYLRMLFVCLKF